MTRSVANPSVPEGALVDAGADKSTAVDRRSRYDTYIGSRAWRESPSRLAELALSGGSCRLCGLGPPEVSIEVHHRTYVRLGREHVSDLCTLCRPCHGLVTAELRRRRYLSFAFPSLRDTPRVLPERALVDRTAGP